MTATIILNNPVYWVGYFLICGPGSSVGIATDYGLDGPGSNLSLH